MKSDLYQLKRLISKMMIMMFALFVGGCAGFGYEKRIVPTASEGWEKIKDPDRAYDFLKHECPDFTISVSDVWVESRLLATGIVVPIVPTPISMGGNLKVVIYLLLDGNFPKPTKDSLQILLPENYTLDPIEFNELGSRYYEYVFPLSSKTENFVLTFKAPYLECNLPPLNYEKKLKIGGGLANMGP